MDKFENGKIFIRFQIYPDTCGRGLSSDLGMLTSQIFIITWTPTLKESRGLDGLKLGKDYDDCALAFHLKAGGRNWSKDLPRMQLRRLILHQSRGTEKACWFSVEPRSVLKKFTSAEDLVTSAWSQSKMKNASLLTGVLSSRLEKKRERLFSDMLLFICGSVYGGGPSAMERLSFANEASKKRWFF